MLRNCVSLLKFGRQGPICFTSQRSVKRWVAPTLHEMKKRKSKLGPDTTSPRSTYLDWNYKAELYAFAKRMNEEFQTDVLQNALTNRSYIVQEEKRQEELGIEEPKLSIADNGQLAKEGEQIISNYVKHYLRTVLPRYPEEGICAIHDFLLTDSLLATVSSHIGTKDIVLCSEFPPSDSTMATSLKAVVAAIASSSGMHRAELFVRDFILTQLAGRDVNDFLPIEQPLAVLEDILAREGRSKPEPRLINEAGRNTILASYQVAIYVDKQYLGRGSGESIAIAAEMAAHDVLRRLFKTTENMNPIPFNIDVSPETRKNLSLNEWNSQNIVQCE